MKKLNVGAIPVCDGKKLVGMVTDRDRVLRVMAQRRDPSTTTVRDTMTPDVCFCYEDEEAEIAADLMAQQQIRRLPILSRTKQLVGIVSLEAAEKLGICQIWRCDLTYGNGARIACRMVKKAVQRGRSERRGDASHSDPPALSLPRQVLFPLRYVEPLSDARTKLADFFSILLGDLALDGVDSQSCGEVLKEVSDPV